MMAFPSMIAQAAEEAGIKVPADPDGEYIPAEYPHWHVFCLLQLGRRVRWGEHWDNAKVIAAIPEEKLKEMHLEDFIKAGL